MEETLTRIVENLIGRIHGPLTFRLILQPLMATIYATLDGRRDAREGKPPYFWALFTDAEHRRDMLKEGWKSVSKVFILAILIDGIYQFMVFQWFYPGEALILALILAIVPYLLLRGPINRIWRGVARGR
ncbi:hypothetical protein MUP29_11690 [bacterium]|nr:hypothetical protein [bacterium]